MTGLALQAAVRSDTGLVRSHNEDSVFASSRLLAVADGVGGRAAGEVASAAVIDQLILMDKSRLSEPLPRALEKAVWSGNASIDFIASCRPPTAGMSTTLTAVAIGDDGYSIANVGDSRAYLLREGNRPRHRSPIPRSPSTTQAELGERMSIEPAVERR